MKWKLGGSQDRDVAEWEGSQGQGLGLVGTV